MRFEKEESRPRILRKILWTVDAFDEESRAFERMALLLEGLTSNAKARIQPVYILGPDQTNLPFELFKKWADDYAAEAKELMSSKLKRVALPGILEPVVLLEKRGSTRSSVAKLLDFAHDHRFTLIATSTHGRKGIHRMLLGSFAETLMLHSDLPLMISNPIVQPMPTIERITVSIKLPFQESTLLDQVTDLARSLESRIRLFHYSGVPVLSPDIPERQRLENDQRRWQLSLSNEAKTIATRMKEKGVAIEVALQSGEKELAEAIVEQISKPAQELLVLFGKRVKGESGDYGAMVRQVVRQFKGTLLFMPESKAVS